MSTSESLHKRRASAVARGVSSVIPSYVDHASGGTVVDVDGREWIDFAAGIAVTSVGNSAPRVVAAVQEQVAKFTHTCFMVAPYESYVAVCEQLNALTPGSFDKRSALFNSGAEAVENAVKVARHATGRQAVVVFDHAYHGRTNLTMALTAKSMPYKHRFGPFAPEVYRAPMSYPLRDGGRSGADAAAKAIEVIEKQVGADNVAAVLIEPIQGEGGFVVPAPGFLPALADWARAAGAVYIADEIQTGFCRTGVLVRLVARGRGAGPGDDRQGHRRRAAAGRRHRALGADGRGTRRWSRRHLRRQPDRVRRLARRDRDHAGAGPERRGPTDRVGHAAGAPIVGRPRSGYRRGARARRDARHRAGLPDSPGRPDRLRIRRVPLPWPAPVTRPGC